MYKAFFGLSGPPFRITPDTSFFYSGGERDALVNAIAYSIAHGDGIIKVVGEVGSGKTMLSRMLASQLPDNTRLVYLLNPSLQASDLIYAIGRDLGIELDSACSKTDALQSVQNKLLDMHANNQRAVVFIDEAQCMPLATLEELRLLSNLETETDKLLQLVLFGQPELDVHLANTSVRQIKERIIHSFYLKPFTRAEVGEYLLFRLHKAGYNGPPLFSAQALRLLTRYSSGLPRKLTILADKSLLAAFAMQSKRVEGSHVRLAAKDCGHSTWALSKQSIAIMGIVLIAFVFAISFYNSGFVNLEQGTYDVRASLIPVSVDPSSQANIDGADTNLDGSLDTGLNSPLVPSHIFIKDAVPEVGVKAEVITIKALTDKTNLWVKASNGAIYTIQILTANADDDKFLEHFFIRVAKDIGINELYLHPVMVDDKSFFAVTLGGFLSLDQASSYLRSLPAFVQRYQPYIKNIKSFKSLD